jgi:uncharacterized membrane protein YfcA
LEFTILSHIVGKTGKTIPENKNWGLERMRKNWYYAITGAVAGLLNGLFGAGGGTVVVPLFEKDGMESKKAHATSIAVILPLSIISICLYMYKMTPPWEEALRFCPLGIVGALIGSAILKKIGNRVLQKIFAGILLISAVRLWMR